MKHFLLFTVLAAVFSLHSCDEGDIIDNTKLSGRDGYTVKMTGVIENLGQWPSGYTVVMAGYVAGDSFPSIAKIVPNRSGSQNFLLGSISTDVQTIELCVVNRINKKIVSLDTIFDATFSSNYNPADTIFYDADGIDAGMFSSIQKGVFNKRCINCHGLSTRNAANLNLTSASSYENLYNVISTKDDNICRVKPYAPDSSMLFKVLSIVPDSTTKWQYDHTRFFYGDNISKLVKDWIESGASK